MLTRKAFKYRLYPTRKQEQTLFFVLRRGPELYNSGLEERRAFYQMRRKSLGYSVQAAELAEIKAAYLAKKEAKPRQNPIDPAVALLTAKLERQEQEIGRLERVRAKLLILFATRGLAVAGFLLHVDRLDRLVDQFHVGGGAGDHQGVGAIVAGQKHARR